MLALRTSRWQVAVKITIVFYVAMDAYTLFGDSTKWYKLVSVFCKLGQKSHSYQIFKNKQRISTMQFSLINGLVFGLFTT